MSEIACGVWHSEFEMYCWRCQQDSRLATEARIAELERERELVRGFIVWLFYKCIVDGGDADGGAVQDKLLELGITEERPALAGSPEAEEWGEGAPLHYLKPEWDVPEPSCLGLDSAEKDIAATKAARAALGEEER